MCMYMYIYIYTYVYIHMYIYIYIYIVITAVHDGLRELTGVVARPRDVVVGLIVLVILLVAVLSNNRITISNLSSKITSRITISDSIGNTTSSISKITSNSSST